MDVSVEQTTSLERRVRISVPAARVDDAVEKRVLEASRTVRLPGFRPGKVPLREVRRRFSDGIRQEVASEVMQSTLTEALVAQSLQPAGTPAVEIDTLVAGSDFAFTATFEVYPDVTIANFDGIEVVRRSADVTEADIDSMIERLRKQRQTFEAADDRVAANGDRITLDYVGSTDGVPFEGGSAEGSVLELGQGRMIPGFEDALLGVRTGEQRTFEVTFPEDYGNKDLAGKVASFATTTHSIETPVLPELDDAFFADFGVEEGGMDAFRADVRASMERELRTAIRTQTKQQVIDALARLHSFDVPAALVESEVGQLRERMLQRMGFPAGQAAPENMLPSNLFEDEAKRRVTVGLVIRAIIDARGIEPDAERVRAMIDDIASSYAQPEQVVQWYYSNRNEMAQVEAAVIEDQVVDLVLEDAAVADEASSYDAIIAGPPPGRGATSQEDSTD